MGFLFKRGFILPVTVAGIVPLALALYTHAWQRAQLFTLIPGVGSWLGGLVLLVWTTGLFASHDGSLAPWNPPTQLVVVGPYRHCRNPMISGVYAMLIGEALALWSLPIAIWGLIFILFMSSQIVFHEEPVLRERFGQPYLDYCDKVPRWLPRLTPYLPA